MIGRVVNFVEVEIEEARHEQVNDMVKIGHPAHRGPVVVYPPRSAVQ